MLVPLGNWVLREACWQAATAWPEAVGVAVNLSATQFQSRTLLQSVVMALATSGLNPRRLELKVTESVLLDGSAAMLETLRQLRALGVRIAMDDFGTGYSSLSALRTFPFDRIAIDRAFEQDLGQAGAKDSLAIVRAVAALGASLGIATTAEGWSPRSNSQPCARWAARQLRAS